MRLVRVELENFRCYKESFSITFADITAIVGRNDVGKSAIMDALAIFFDEEKPDKDDATIDGNRKAVRITCEFDDLPSALIIDEDFETTLAAEYLLNQRGNLEITKTYDGSLTGTPKLTSVEASCVHPTTKGFDDLLELKKSELTARAKELDVDLAGVNKKANAPIREAIWASADDLALASRNVSLMKEGGRLVWTALGANLPGFALFKSDRASTDQDAEAQDPLKAAIRDAIKKIEPKLREVQGHVEDEVKKIATATVEKLKEMDPALGESLNPVITSKKWDTLFQTSITGDQGIPLNKRGSGIKRLVLLNFFRAQAERTASEKSSSSIIYAVEEPETSQHPRNQRMLMAALTTLASSQGRQVVVTTHTPMLARTLPETSLRYLHRTEENKPAVSYGGQGDTNQKIAASLGVLPDHSVNAFVGVEGKHDISFLKGLSQALRTNNADLPNLEALEVDGKIIFFPFGGSNLALWASRLAALNRPEYHICDRDNQPPDPPKYEDHINAVNARDGCTAVTTRKREAENYIHPAAIIQAYEANGLAGITLPNSFSAFDDVPQIVAKAVHAQAGEAEWDTLSPESQRKKTSNAKSVLNNSAASLMTADLLEETDPDGEVVGWLQAIGELATIDP